MRPMIFLLLLTGLLGPSQRGDANALDGEWIGKYVTGEGGGSLSIKIGRANGAVSVAVRATSQYAAEPRYISAADVRIDGDAISFRLDWGTIVTWEGKLKDAELSGSMKADHWSGTWSVRRKVD